MKKVIAILVLGLMLSGNAYATSLSYKKYNEDPERYLGYVVGILEGVSWVNIIQKNISKKEFYCAPKDFYLSYEKGLEILKEEVARARSDGLTMKEINEQPVGMLITNGVKDTFPC